ncbi:hypothetical protein [Acetobacterium bakii]|uniref:Gram-positive cocci surface proteins LPxTG domain-containing protein n=1 Tax=Acetobacterium bakii TaxID=52689 RepID=A0A0L6U2K1_9FIRM|nr:hypothetical protein [Acetobacterium bakii]KNZ42731.1 hypothetical protein AKG39_04670 [Acetobacterium bakii]
MKRMSKFVSMLMVVAMLFMLLPVSALGADSEETAKPGDNEITLVLVTTETAAEDAVASEPAISDLTTDPTAVLEQTTTDEINVPAAPVPETKAVPEQGVDPIAPVVPAPEIIALTEQPEISAISVPVVEEKAIVSRDVKQPYYGSSNPKTGVNTRVKDALVVGAMILSLVALAIAGSKQEDKA